MQDLLKRYFGFDAFRPMQEAVIKHVLSGQDTFAVMPTGAGKSLCYQLPALALEGTTLVVSPLVALMKDQVDSLRANGIAAAFVNSTLPPAEIQSILQAARRGEWKLLYVAPERLANPWFQSVLSELMVKLIVVDEAHCISEWGHDFRPDYRNLSQLRQILPQATWIALTATANARVRQDVAKQLGLATDKIFLSSFNRPNLTYVVRPKKASFEVLVKALEGVAGSSAIVYCFSRKDTEKMAEQLRHRGFKALPYHAGLDDKTRRQTQEQFIRDVCPIIVATVAFGMGIDKPNVRLVVHADLPRSVEGYYQETGRAGRDGLPGTCLLLYSAADRWKREYFIRMIQDRSEQARSRDQLAQMMGYAEGRGCRRKFLLEYFSETWAQDNCGSCDVCLGTRVDENPVIKVAADHDEELFDRLRTLRRRLADERGVPAFVVFGDKTLQEMARLYPQSAASFDRISGVGREKAKKFGEDFIAEIKAYAEEAGGKPDLVSIAAPVRSSGGNGTSDTLIQTKILIEQKLPLADIAKQRDLVISTILGHIEKLGGRGVLDIEYLCPPAERVEAIRKAFKQAGGYGMTPIKERLGDEYSYDDIRIARLFF